MDVRVSAKQPTKSVSAGTSIDHGVVVPGGAQSVLSSRPGAPPGPSGTIDVVIGKHTAVQPTSEEQSWAQR